MQSLQAQHTHGVLSIPALPVCANTASCVSCLLHKAHAAPRNTYACPKSPLPLTNLSCDIWGPVNVPSPHGLRYCLLVIDHHTTYMWVRFLKSKDDTCPQLESILLEIRHTHARHHSSSGAFAPVLEFDSDPVFEATSTRLMCGRLGVGGPIEIKIEIVFKKCTVCGIHQIPYAPVAVSGPSQLCHTRNIQVRARPLTTYIQPLQGCSGV
jgi:hypothetical protein